MMLLSNDFPVKISRVCSKIRVLYFFKSSFVYGTVFRFCIVELNDFEFVKYIKSIIFVEISIKILQQKNIILLTLNSLFVVE